MMARLLPVNSPNYWLTLEADDFCINLANFGHPVRDRFDQFPGMPHCRVGPIDANGCLLVAESDLDAADPAHERLGKERDLVARYA